MLLKNVSVTDIQVYRVRQ